MDSVRRTRDADESPPDEHASHLARSRKVWDRWSGHYGLSESDFEPMREVAMDHLGLQPGDRVLEIGCGPGVNFERIRRDVGADGSLLAVDYSPKMVERARGRIADSGWNNVEVVLADATTASPGDDFDAAIATLSLSVMPDIRAVVENVHGSLAPGGLFVVFDLRPVPHGPARVLNPLVRRLLYWFANWNRDGDVIDSLETVFERFEVRDTYGAGTAYTALARKSSA